MSLCHMNESNFNHTTSRKNVPKHWNIVRLPEREETTKTRLLIWIIFANAINRFSIDVMPNWIFILCSSVRFWKLLIVAQKKKTKASRQHKKESFSQRWSSYLAEWASEWVCRFMLWLSKRTNNWLIFSFFFDGLWLLGLRVCVCTEHQRIFVSISNLLSSSSPLCCLCFQYLFPVRCLTLTNHLFDVAIKWQSKLHVSIGLGPNGSNKR